MATTVVVVGRRHHDGVSSAVIAARDAADVIRVPFRMGDPEALLGLATTALVEPAVTRHSGVARFESVHTWVHTEVRGWTFADSIDDHEFAALHDAAQEQLIDLVTASGVTFDVSALVVNGSTVRTRRRTDTLRIGRGSR